MEVLLVVGVCLQMVGQGAILQVLEVDLDIGVVIKLILTFVFWFFDFGEFGLLSGAYYYWLDAKSALINLLHLSIRFIF